MTELRGQRNKKEKARFILKQWKTKWQSDQKQVKENAVRRMRQETRPLIEPWTKKRKWGFFMLGTVAIVLSGQLFSLGHINAADAAALFAIGTILDIIGLWLTEKRIRYFELDVKSDSIGTGNGNIEERLSDVEDFVKNWKSIHR